MTTLNIAVAEILEKGEIGKRTVVELKETDFTKDNIPYGNAMELEGLAYHLVETMTEEASVEDLTKVYSHNELMTMGEKVYMTACAACHQPTGAGLPPAFPALKGSVIATGDIAVHIDMVLNGSKKNAAMAAFASQLTKTEIAAVVTYERNAWGNNTGDLVQPAAVDAASAK